MSLAFKTTVYLGSNMIVNNLKEKPKRQFFSIIYLDPEKKKMHMDLTSFRPDPLDHLSPDKKYDAVLNFKKEIGCKGDQIDFLQNIKIGGRTFIKIR
ncbi:MAG TPA: hypothetical protein PKD85_09235 [Saprospiraceae bacterium]|nr:hypothetical protein [Saprospiraceae bacterium]